MQRCVRLVSYIASGLGPDILSRCAISYFSRTKSLFHNSSKISSRKVLYSLMCVQVGVSLIFHSFTNSRSRSLSSCTFGRGCDNTIHKGIVYMLALDQIKNGYVSF